jgi:hypothetical protein
MLLLKLGHLQAKISRVPNTVNSDSIAFLAGDYSCIAAKTEVRQVCQIVETEFSGSGLSESR